MKLAILGGTFDPIHNGHLILARDAIDSLDLHTLLFVPNHLSPHKLAHKPVPAELRADMVRAAIHGEPGFAFHDSEILRPGPSYAIDTVLHLRQLHPDASSASEQSA
ncbi:nicotinate-nicotinamide nucleotide adenylyltransferase, partial [Pseudomonas aeruginosa]|uniref:nicotinate-nicotinamide nucleotide adenylyltransferase n=1 Tax=Pseudomonas aeruginosa TaxID=287 RepID=UPI0011BF5256